MKSALTIIASVVLAAPLAWATGDVEITSFRAPGGPQVDDVRSLVTTADGSLWVGTNGGGVSRYDGSAWTHFSAADIGMRGVASITEASDRSLWFGGPGGVSRFDGEKWTQYGEQMGRAIRVAFSGFTDTDGSIWFATNAGAVRYDGKTWAWTTTENGLRHDVVHDVLRDKQGNLWFATRRGGLSRLRDGEWTHFLADFNVRGILQDKQGNLWFGTGGGGVHQFDGKEWKHHHAEETVLPLFEDSRGNVWFARPGGGALRYRGGAWTVHADHVPDGEIHAGAEGTDRSLWFGADTGLSRFRKNTAATR